MAFGALWTVVPLAMHTLRERLPLSYGSLGGATAVLAVVLAANNLSVRETFAVSAVNRAQARIPLAIFGAQGVLLLAGWMLGLAPAAALVLCMTLWALGGGMLALLFDARLVLLPIGYVLALLAAAARPDQVLLWAAAGNALAGANVAVVWIRVGTTAEAEGERKPRPDRPR